MTDATIMIVEDEGIVAMDMKTRLQRYGYRVKSVLSSGEEALRRAAEEKPDLVLMDIMLKGPLDGITAATRLRKDHAIPVVYVTSYADPDTLAKAQLTEPYGYILKPFDERELKVNIEMTLHKSRIERENRESEIRRENRRSNSDSGRRGPERPRDLTALSQGLSRDLQACIREIEEFAPVLTADRSDPLSPEERTLLLSVLKQLEQIKGLMRTFLRD